MGGVFQGFKRMGMTRATFHGEGNEAEKKIRFNRGMK